MTIQEAQQFFAGSGFSAETKQKIAELLSSKETLDPYTVLEVKALMHEELAQDLDKEGIDVSKNPEVKALENDYDEKLKKIDLEMKHDVAFVESELDELEKIRKQVMQVSDSLDADAIRASM